MFSIRDSRDKWISDGVLLLAAVLSLLIGLATLYQLGNGLWQPDVVAAMAVGRPDYDVGERVVPVEPDHNPMRESRIEAAALARTGRWKSAEDKLGCNVMRFLEQECTRNQVPVALALGVIEAESNFETDIVSPTNDYGLMQINAGPNYRYHEYYKELLGVQDFLDPYDNIRVGVYLLGDNLKKSNGNVQLSLMSYHLGNSAARRRWNEGVRTTSATSKQLSRYYQYLSEQP